MIRKENRIVVVNWEGKVCEYWGIEIQENIQDDGKTLKLFLRKEHSDNTACTKSGGKK